MAQSSPNGRELRFHSSAVYGALDSAGEMHPRLMQQLDVQVAERGTTRAR